MKSKKVLFIYSLIIWKLNKEVRESIDSTLTCNQVCAVDKSFFNDQIERFWLIQIDLVRVESLLIISSKIGVPEFR